MDKLQKIFLEVFNLQAEELNDNVSIDNTPSWDSFSHIMLMSKIEEELGIDFTIDEIGEIRNYKALREIIEAKLSR